MDNRPERPEAVAGPSKVESPEELSAVRTVPSTLELDMTRAFRVSGNKHFERGNYHEALKTYDEALVITPDDDDLLVDRSFCHYKLTNYPAALEDALRVLKDSPKHVKATYRAAETYMQLEDYRNANRLLEDIRESALVTDDDFGKLSGKAKELAEQSRGHYDMARMINSRNEGRHVLDDVIEYVGPIRESLFEQKGRGLVATRDVEPGTLLMACRAFAAINFTANENDNANFKESLLDVVIEKVKKSPEKLRDLYGLHAGKKLGHLRPSEVDVSTIDYERIKAVIDINSHIESFPGDEFSHGVWILPSFINNDCYDVNCSMALYGDLRFVRCLKPIKSGEELRTCYREAGEAFRERTAAFSNMEFDCLCQLCQYERAEPEPVRQMKDQALKEVSNRTTSDLRGLMSNVVRIKQAFADHPRYVEYYLPGHLYNLAKGWFSKKQRVLSIRSFKEYLDIYPRSGGDRTETLYNCSGHLFLMYFLNGDLENAKIWRDQYHEHIKLKYGYVDDALLEAVGSVIRTTITHFDLMYANMNP